MTLENKKPKTLKPGSRVAAVCLSQGLASEFPELYDWGRQQLAQHFELELVPMKNTMRSVQEIYANPMLRLSDFYEAWQRPDIDGVISVIGGEDSCRLLKHWDKNLLSQHCKVFVGMSDTTVTHLFLQQMGINSFYGPAVLYGFADFAGLNPYSSDSFRRAVMSGQPIGEIKPYSGQSVAGFSSWKNPDFTKLPTLRDNPCWRWLNGKGKHRGRLFGGCVEVIYPMLANTICWPREASFYEDKILFLEYSHELATAEYTSWWLRSLAAQGVLAEVKGLCFGRNHFSVPEEETIKIAEALLKVVVIEEGLRNLPIVMDMDFGHVQPMMTLPLGCLAEIDCDRNTFSILEAATIG
jgi:muramoyltetrapeptide carboxypeptidase LdcA involved in peptidoglycan recycling